MCRVVFAKVFLLAFLTYSYAAYAHSSNTFAWLKPSEDAQIFKQIKSDFSEDLTPDDPKRTKPIVPYLYKYISRVGCFDSSCIVIIGFRAKESEPAEYDHFRAFTYDLIKRTKHEIEPNGIYYRWTFLSYSSFEPSLTADVVFKYLSCMECEAVELLSSFKYERASGQWTLRIWPNKDPHILVGSDLQYGADIWSYDCLFKLTDFTKHGFDDLVVRCKETGLNTHKVNDHMYLYTIKNGNPEKDEIRDKTSFDRFNAILCIGNSDSTLCK